MDRSAPLSSCTLPTSAAPAAHAAAAASKGSVAVARPSCSASTRLCVEEMQTIQQCSDEPSAVLSESTSHQSQPDEGVRSCGGGQSSGGKSEPAHRQVRGGTRSAGRGGRTDRTGRTGRNVTSRNKVSRATGIPERVERTANGTVNPNGKGEMGGDGSIACTRLSREDDVEIVAKQPYTCAAGVSGQTLMAGFIVERASTPRPSKPFTSTVMQHGCIEGYSPKHVFASPYSSHGASVSDWLGTSVPACFDYGTEGE